MVFWPNLCVDLHLRLCGGQQAASAQKLDRLDIGPEFSFPDRERMGVRRAGGEGFHA